MIEKSVTSKLPEVNKAGYSYSTRRPVTETLVFSYKIAGLLGHVLLLKKKKKVRPHPLLTKYLKMYPKNKIPQNYHN